MPQGFSNVILLHVAAAVLALGVGAFVFLRRKGTTPHRWMGRAWTVLMLATAVSSFFITGVDGKYSWIHGLSVAVPLLLARGVLFAIQGKVAAHRITMTGIYAGALGIAGMFALLPNRMLGQMLWSSLGLL